MIVRLADRHGLKLIAREEDAARCADRVAGLTEADLAGQADAIASLGGDGTMLGALRLVARRPVPVLGVNLGNLGFLVEVQPGELPEAVERLERGEFSIEHWRSGGQGRRPRVVRVQRRRGRPIPGDAVVHAELMVGGQRGGHFRCDGLVLATPSGSTAYGYAAGGPLVPPALGAVVITALAPMSGISRPMVVSAQEPVRLTLIESSGQPALEVDGAVVTRLDAGATIDVTLAPRAGQVVRLDADRHKRRNLVKLSLLDLPLLPEELRELGPSIRPA